MLTRIKSNKHNLIIWLLYALLIIPMCYSIFYSVPASDDFAMALGRANSKGFFTELFSNTAFFYMKRGGTIIGFFVEMVINPLNAHVHLGHAYGIYMIIAFLLCSAGVIYSVRTIVDYILYDVGRLQQRIAALVAIAVMFSTYYYVEAFNWFVGMIAYEMPMVMELLAFAYIIRYTRTGKKKYLVGMIITGIIAANNTVMDVPLGLFFLYVVFYKPGFDKSDIKGNIKKVLPLIVFMISGLVGVVAPGNFVRKSQYVDEAGPSVVRIALQVAIDIAQRIFRIIVDHPFTVLLFIILIYIGVLSNADRRKKTPSILMVLIVGIIAVAGSLFPYVYARGFTTTYLDVRIEYVMDYFLELVMCTVCLLIGRRIAEKIDLIMTPQINLGIVSALILFAYVCVINNYGYLDIIQVDILKSKSIITSSYELWDGILTEIEESDEDDVVVTRDYNIKWSPYFFYSGIDDGVVYDDDPSVVYSTEHIRPNVYYQKNSIVLNIPDTPNE